MFSDNIIYEYPPAKRIVVIGDLHGDLKRFKNILLDAKIINNNIEWIADPPNTIIVQLGDQIDSLNRDPLIKDWEKLQDIETIYFTNNLDMIARSKGGMVISLIGNHELINSIGVFTYVSKLNNTESRINYFKPKGTLSPILGKRPIIVKIGDLCFCHAGLNKYHIDILNKNNKTVSYLNDLWRQYILNGKIDINDKEIFDKILLDSEGILWTRSLDNKDIVTNVLKNIGCQFMFVGHTPVENIKLVSDKIFYVDTGISRSFGTKSYQYLNIDNFAIDIKTIQDNE